MNTRIALPKVIGFNKAIISERMHLSRLETIKRLSDGLYHDISGLLSVIMVESELFESKMEGLQAVELGTELMECTKKTNRAAKNIGYNIELLREITTIGKEKIYDRLPLSKFIVGLPELVKGYSKQLKDNKNITLTFELKIIETCNLYVTYASLLDYILYFVVSLMNKAVCSGEVKVSLEAIAGKEKLIFAFGNDLLGGITLEDFLSEIFPDYFHNEEREQAGKLKESLILSYSFDILGICSVEFSSDND